MMIVKLTPVALIAAASAGFAPEVPAAPVNVGAMLTPIALAVFRLTARTNLAGFCTGKSPARAPFNTRST